jgi:dTDP-4-amino-4,6-dideoxygalactose transaminase
MSPKLGGKTLKVDDEIIVSGITSPAIIGVIISLGCIPVLTEIAISSGNPLPHHISNALSEKTKVILLEHTLGNPFDILSIREIAEANSLYFIELCGNFYGASYLGERIGTYSDIAIWDKAILTNDTFLGELVQTSTDFLAHNQLGGGSIPDNIEGYANTHRSNWEYLKTNLCKFSKYFILPDCLEHAEPDWGGFALTIKYDMGIGRTGLIDYLNNVGVGSFLPDASIDWMDRTQYPCRVTDAPKARMYSSNTFYIGTSEYMTPERLESSVSRIKYFMDELR